MTTTTHKTASSPIGTFLRVNGVGEVTISGVELPSKTKCVAVNSQAIVISVPGHTRWNGNHVPRVYQPAETQVFLIEEVLEEGSSWKVRPLISHEKSPKKN